MKHWEPEGRFKRVCALIVDKVKLERILSCWKLMYVEYCVNGADRLQKEVTPS